MLAPDHVLHLQTEGFTDDHITQLQALGVRTVEADEAKHLGYKVWDATKTPHSSRGILVPFTKSFGQVRADTPPINSKGKPCKYITPVGKTSQCYIPDGCEVITEGFFDALAGGLHGGVATGAIAGVSHYRKALKPGAGYTMLFDSDGWSNPQVFANLIHAGHYLNGKIVLVPPIPGEPKGGLSEYFKSGKKALDYERLVKSALRPKKLLMEWPAHWEGFDTATLAHCARVAIALAVKYLPFIDQEALLTEIAKASKLRKTALNKQLKQLREIDERRQRNAELKEQKTEAGLSDADNVPTEMTIEEWVYLNVFGGGNGEWAVLDDMFHQYQPQKGYWLPIAEQAIERKIAQRLRTAYREYVTKSSRTIKMQGTNRNLKAALSTCRSLLQVVGPQRNADFIAFGQTTVDVRTGAAVPHSKDYYLTTCIESDYHPELDPPPAFREFIARAYGEDLEEMIRACLSMLIDPSAPYGKFLHLKGPTGSGKGTLISVIRAIFGKSYRSNTDFSLLNSPDKRHQFLKGCSVYAFGDISGYLQHLNGFYELVDNVAMDGRALQSSSGYNKQWNIRFIIGSVHHLQIENAGEGWGRRALILPTKPRQGPPDPRLKESVLEEIPAIVAWALGMDRERRNAILKDPEAHCERIAQELSEAKLSADPVSMMLDRCFRPATDAELLADGYPLTMESEELYACYTAFATAHRFANQLQPNTLIHRLSSTIALHAVKRKRVDGKMRRAHWRNLRPVPGVFVEGDGEIFNGVAPLTYNAHKTEDGGIEEFEAFQNAGGIEGWRSYLAHQEEVTPVESNGHHVEPQFETAATTGLEEY